MKINIILAIGMLIIWAGLTNNSFAGENIWTNNGPYGGSIKAIAIHPSNSDIIFVGTIGGNGVYKSTNAGQSWEYAGADVLSSTQRKIIFNPLGPDTVYDAAVDGVYKSTDCGASWFNITPIPRWGNEFRAIALDPIHPNIIIAGGPWDQWKSTDSGEYWRNMPIEPDSASGFDLGIEALAINPVNPDIVYLVTESAEFGKGIYKSTDEGESWFRIQNNSDSCGWGTDVAVDPVNPEIIYYARFASEVNQNGTFLSKSTNGGDYWTDISPPGLSEWACNAIRVSPLDHNKIYAATSADGVYKSANGGQTWSPINNGLHSFNCATLEIDIITGALYLGTFGSGIYKSTDDGANWIKISQNISAFSCQDLSFVASPSQSIFVAGQGGLYYLADENGEWQYCETGMSVHETPAGLICDPILPSNIYITSFSPYTPPIVSGGFYFSADTGHTWQFHNDGLPPDGDFWGINVSCHEDGARRIFLASAYGYSGAGLYYSDDLGENWTLCQGGLPNGNIFLIQIASMNPDIIAVSDDLNNLFISTDRGQYWTRAASIPRIDEGWIEDIRFDPTDQNHIFASSASNGLYESFDLGQDWHSIVNDLPLYSGYPIVWGPAINPYNPANLFVASNHRGVYQSHDGGNHWESFNDGLDSTSYGTGKIYFVPGDTTRLYLASHNNSVWSIHRTITGINDNDKNIPNYVTLNSYPNPFNASTTIKYSIPKSSFVSIDIYDILGRKIERLISEKQTAGEHSVIWDATDASSGVYFYKIEAGDYSESKKCLLSK